MLSEEVPRHVELRPARFTHLNDAAQREALAGWAGSRLALRRLAFLALRNLAFVGYWSQDETWSAIGYAGPLIGRGGAAT